MVNIVTIAFVHAVLFIAAFRLMMRSDLDADLVPSPDAGAGDDANGDDEPQTPSERRRARLRASQEKRDQ
ncbi:hypothetical protein [Erythrobacter sp. YT30]|uniref:hypothetical protein n=1 Tax=Erythrobacter sp. YT30 TaxID=1735012 RepID=UPI00076D0F63|nr:hypothetical protein [Erythrobacter sp. YT30]KWV91546.1 hypothetical protein AUC45_09950 [Erythrobacter sp. YT30]